MSPAPRLRVRATRFSVRSFSARIDVCCDASGPAWIDFIGAQLLGSSTRPEERPSFETVDENSMLVDQGVIACCVMASNPRAVTEGLALQPGQTSSFVVTCDRVPVGMPPSFDGKSICCEYLLLVTARAMAPRTPGWFSGWFDDDDADPFERGPIVRTRIPLHFDCDAAYRHQPTGPGMNPSPRSGVALGCELSCSAVDGAQIERERSRPRAVDMFSGFAGEDAYAWDDDDDKEGDEDESDSDESDGGECSPESRLFSLQLDSVRFAAVEFASDVNYLGGAVRGMLELYKPASRVHVALNLEERPLGDVRPHAGSSATTSNSAAANESSLGAAASSRTVARAELSRGSCQLRSASFELPVPSHFPPSTTISTANGALSVELIWVALFTFEREGGPVPWRLPLRVLPVERRRVWQLQLGRLPAPGLARREQDETMIELPLSE